jgi:hypothetical protein
MITDNLFSVVYNSDTTEGRGHMVTLGFTRSRELAEAIVSDKRFSKYCGMGFHNVADCCKFNVRPAEVVIFESVEDMYGRDEAAERQTALAKLTPHERKLLKLE